eukprot:965861-Rhodomonas_salina.1
MCFCCTATGNRGSSEGRASKLRLENSAHVPVVSYISVQTVPTLNNDNSQTCGKTRLLPYEQRLSSMEQQSSSHAADLCVLRKPAELMSISY